MAIGRLSGGFLVDAFNWRAVFYLTLFFSLTSLVLGVFLLPAEGRRVRQQVTVDLWGICTLGGFLVPLMLALTQGRFEGWDSPYIRLLFLLSAGSFIAFVLVELYGKTPVVNLRLYTNFDFALGSLVQFLVSILFMSSTFLITIFLQRVYQYTPSQVGVLTFHEGWVFGVGGLLAGRMADRVDPRLPLVFGLVCFAIVYFWLGSLSAVAPAALIVAMLCLRSFAYATVNSPNMLIALRTLPEAQVGMATGLFAVSRSISGSLGVALSAFLLEHQRLTHAIELAQQQAGLAFPSELAMTGLHQAFTGLGDVDSVAQVKASAQFHRMLMGEATVTAYQDIFILSGLISLFNILPGLLKPRREPEPERDESPMRAPHPTDTVSSPKSFND